LKPGLLGCPSEKTAVKLTDSVNRDIFSSPVSEQLLRNGAHFLQFSEYRTALFALFAL
jgi:hypothetical protein